MDNDNKVSNILKLVKLSVEDKLSFGKDIDSITSMFDQLASLNLKNHDDKSQQKKVQLSALRVDKAVDSDFRKEMRGKYFKVPKVISK